MTGRVGWSWRIVFAEQVESLRIGQAQVEQYDIGLRCSVIICTPCRPVKAGTAA